ncbi:MAG: phenylacetate--CoA ligase [Tissierellia bacterium]|nr:phenylacetate--CoA ligase [Tissierellia bacterium]
MIWAKEESLSREELEVLQLERIQNQVRRGYELVEPYRKKMQDKGMEPGDLKTLADVKSLPFITKQDFRDNYPFGLFAVPKSELRRIHASSGTTGKPTVVGYTERDMKNWTDTVSRMAVMGGARTGDIAQISFGYGMFTGALGLHYGLENLGIDIVPASAGNTAKQIMYLRDFEATILVATPSYALHIAESVVGQGLDPQRDFSLRVGLLGGEGLSEKMRGELRDIWGDGVLFTQNYGMSELNGPGISGECEALTGMHVNEDHFLVEIIDPDTEEVLPAGSQGELVVTCLTKEAIPLVRYRTRDITTLHYEPCPCGRTTVRMEATKGRSDDMLLIRGVNVFPTQIEEALLEIDEIGANYEILIDRIKHLDIMEVKVELADYSLLESYALLEKLENTIRSRIRTIVGIDAVIKLVAPRSLQRFEGKAKRVTDNRVN